jgi:hypothetical protein
MTEIEPRFLGRPACSQVTITHVLGKRQRDLPHDRIQWGALLAVLNDPVLITES